MENSHSTPADAAVALDAAEAARSQLVERLVLPSAFFTSIGAAVAVQIAAAAVGIARQDGRGLLVVAAGLAVFTLTAIVQLARFRRRNGVWLAGLASRVVLGAATTGSTVYAVALGAAVWAAFSDAWWVTAVSSVVGGGGYALSGRRWLRTYRANPEEHGRPDSTTWTALAGLAALAGLLALAIAH